VSPPIYFPPGFDVPPPPPVPEGEALALVITAGGAKWFTYKTERPEHKPVPMPEPKK
jgi:hypothetical protein